MEKVKEISDEKKKAKRKELDEKIMKKVQLKRTENPESVKSQQNSRTQMCREKMKAKDQEAVKRAQNCQRQKNRKEKKNEDHEALKKDQSCQRKKNRKEKEAKDQQIYREDMRMEKAKQRRVETAIDRLRLFREATMCSAIFICISCHTRQSKSNVQEFLESKFDDSISLHEFIVDLNLRTNAVIGENPASINRENLGKRYICSLCLKNIKMKKLTGRAVMNNLQLYDTDADLVKEELLLTELEGSLVAKNIIFQKLQKTFPMSKYTTGTQDFEHSNTTFSIVTFYIIA